MNIYQMVHGVNPDTFFVLPMLGKHADEYPRFRDCKAADDGFFISVLTRTGGSNRGTFEAEHGELRSMPTYLSDHDVENDSTYAYWIFAVPTEWQLDFELIKLKRLTEISAAYLQQMKTVYPKLASIFETLCRPSIATIMATKAIETAERRIKDQLYAKDGLLWDDRGIVKLPRADHLAYEFGYPCAEMLVKELEKDPELLRRR